MNNAFETRLAEISQAKPLSLRGRLLETFVADLFRENHFEALENPGSAWPRQTDVLASRNGEVYLIECKWRAARATIDDVDTLRSRLRRTAIGTIGILVSVNGFTGSVIHDVEHDRQRQVLLLSGDELRSVASGPRELPTLIWRKRTALLASGRVLLDEEPPRRRLAPSARLSNSACSFAPPDGPRISVVKCGGGYGPHVFVHQLPDIDWGPATGVGVTLDIPLSLVDDSELIALIGQLSMLGWTTVDARWTIQQSTVNWHGFGASEFAKELALWQSHRNIDAPHHSEEVCYFDQCDNGFYTISAIIASHRSRVVSAAVLSFQLAGIPLDNAPLLQLCKSYSLGANVHFRARAEASVKRIPLTGARFDNLTPVGVIVDARTVFSKGPTERVTGVVVRNPLRDDRDFVVEAALGLLDESEYLVCDLRESHYIDEARYEYVLERIEISRTSEVAIYRPLANWRRVGLDDQQDSKEFGTRS